MFKINLRIRWLALLVLALSITACKKGCDDPPQNACEGKNLDFKADMEFTIPLMTAGRIPRVEEFLIPFDSILADGSTITFRAKGSYDSVKWKVGVDTRTFTDTQFVLRFSSGEQRIPVQMIGYRKAAEIAGCSGAKAVDTVTKVFTQLPRSGNRLPFLGTFLGAIEDNPSDTFRVRIWDTIEDPFANIISVYLHNFPKGCSNVKPNQGNVIDIQPTYRGFGFERWHTYRTNTAGSCTDIDTNLENGIGHLAYDNKTLTMTFTEFNKNTNNRRLRKFVGLRVN